MGKLELMNWEDVIDLDFPNITTVSGETRQAMIKFAKTHSIGNVRLAMGRFPTGIEYESLRKRVDQTYCI